MTSRIYFRNLYDITAFEHHYFSLRAIFGNNWAMSTKVQAGTNGLKFSYLETDYNRENGIWW